MYSPGVRACLLVGWVLTARKLTQPARAWTTLLTTTLACSRTKFVIDVHCGHIAYMGHGHGQQTRVHKKGLNAVSAQTSQPANTSARVRTHTHVSYYQLKRVCGIGSKTRANAFVVHVRLYVYICMAGLNARLCLHMLRACSSRSSNARKCVQAPTLHISTILSTKSLKHICAGRAAHGRLWGIFAHCLRGSAAFACACGLLALAIA